MSISSLILRSSSILTFVLCTLLDSTSAQSTPVYALDTEYSGSTFFDGWNFFDEADPTHGFVTYVDEATAVASGLIQTGSGSARMNVDSTHTYNPNTAYSGVNGLGRPSVRIESKKSWTHGLFIAKIDHMPGGVCGTWPAWWTLGSGEWPYNGEIDIIEGVNNRNKNTAALHTGSESTITNGQSDNCQWSGGNSVGCTIADTDPASYGTQYNTQGGGTWAMQWTSEAINIWSFPYGQVPSNVNSANPDPSTWGTPSQTFGGPDLHVDSNFRDHRMVFDTTFCGDFADAVWTSEGCAAQTGYSTCAAYVAKNPAIFANAYWQVGYVRVFQQSGTSTSAPKPGTTTSASKSIPAMASSSVASSPLTTSSNSHDSLIPPASLGSKSSSTAVSSSYSVQDPIISSNAYSFHPIATGFSTVSPPSSTFLLGSSSSSSESTVTVTLVGSPATTSTLTLVHIESSTPLTTTMASSSIRSFTRSTTSTTTTHYTMSTATTRSITTSPAASSTTAIVSSASSYPAGSMEVGAPVMADTSQTDIATNLSASSSSVVRVSSTSDSSTTFAATTTQSVPGVFVTVSTSTSTSVEKSTLSPFSSSISINSASTSTSLSATLVASPLLQSAVTPSNSVSTSSAVEVSASPIPSASLESTSVALSAITQTVVPLPATPSPSPTQSETPDSTTNSATPTPTDPNVQPDQDDPFPFLHRHGHGHWRGSFFRGGRPPVLRTRNVEPRAFPGFPGFSGFNPFRQNNYVSRIEYVCPSTKKRAAAPEPEPEAIPVMNEAPMTQPVETTSTSESGSESTQDISPRSIPASIGQTYAAPPVAVEAYTNEGSIMGVGMDPSTIAGLGLDAGWLKVFCVGMMMSGFWVLGLAI